VSVLARLPIPPGLGEVIAGFPSALEIRDAANHRAGSRSLIRFGAKPVKADPFVER
jgi:hypothetical protein